MTKQKDNVMLTEFIPINNSCILHAPITKVFLLDAKYTLFQLYLAIQLHVCNVINSWNFDTKRSETELYGFCLLSRL